MTSSSYSIPCFISALIGLTVWVGEDYYTQSGGDLKTVSIHLHFRTRVQAYRLYTTNILTFVCTYSTALAGIYDTLEGPMIHDYYCTSSERPIKVGWLRSGSELDEPSCVVDSCPRFEVPANCGRPELSPTWTCCPAKPNWIALAGF